MKRNSFSFVTILLLGLLLLGLTSQRL